MTDEERCEVAAELRELAQESARCGDDGVGERACRVLLGPRVDLLDVVDAHFPLARLADLIEPEERTCHLECVKSGPFYDVFRFDCCGKEYSESRTDDGATELPLAVCPFCGAKVIHDA